MGKAVSFTAKWLTVVILYSEFLTGEEKLVFIYKKKLQDETALNRARSISVNLQIYL